MLEISVCVGSACHLKGSYDVINEFKKCVKENSLENELIIKGAFCLGHCTEAVSVEYKDKIYSVVPDTAEQFFNDIVMKDVER